MSTGYATRQDVLDVLAKAGLSGPYSQRPELIDKAVTGLTEDIRARTGRHWYDPGATGDLLPTAPVTAAEQRYDVPSSPHSQRDQLYHNAEGIRYPVTTHGPYARITLDHVEVDSLSALRVRDRAGDVRDWITASEYDEGRGEDYYLATPSDAGPAAHTRLYVRGASLPGVADLSGILSLDYDYGRDTVPDTVRRMTAYMAAASLITEDELVTDIPDDGQLVNVETKADRWESLGSDLMENYLKPA